MKKLSIAALVAAPVLVLAGGGTAFASTTATVPPPISRACVGTVDGIARTITGAYADAGNFPGCTAAQGFPASFPQGFTGSFYATATYTAGGDGWATVVCIPAGDPASDTTAGASYTAVSGGVEEDDGVGNNGPAGSSVIASFPGNMDFTGDSGNNTPTGALDGWVIGLGNPDATNLPLKVWALCVPNTDFAGTTTAPPVVNNNYS